MSLESQIDAIISGQDGGSLYNYDASTAGSKKRSKKKVAKTPEFEDAILYAGCQQCGAKCEVCTRAQPAAPMSAGRRKRAPMTEESKAKRRAGAKGSPWIAHIKQVAKDKGLTYGEAMRVAKETYKK